MSSFPLFSSVLPNRPYLPAMRAISAKAFLTASLPNVVPASRLEVRPTAELVSSGIRALDALTGGLPRGSLTEVCGEASSGRTSMLLALLAAATQRQEVCALVDASDAFDPLSAAAAGVHFERLLWVRCGENTRRRHKDKTGKTENLEQALRVSDLLLQSGGFGLVAIDLADVPGKIARRIPLVTWFRFQRAVEHTATVLCVITPKPCAQSCAALVLSMQAELVGRKRAVFSFQPSPEFPRQAQLFEGFNVRSEVLRSRMSRKPAQSVRFATQATRFA
jgi:hypothetical protein